MIVLVRRVGGPPVAARAPNGSPGQAGPGRDSNARFSGRNAPTQSRAECATTNGFAFGWQAITFATAKRFISVETALLQREINGLITYISVIYRLHEGHTIVNSNGGKMRSLLAKGLCFVVARAGSAPGFDFSATWASHAGITTMTPAAGMASFHSIVQTDSVGSESTAKGGGK